MILEEMVELGKRGVKGCEVLKRQPINRVEIHALARLTRNELISLLYFADVSMFYELPIEAATDDELRTAYLNKRRELFEEYEEELEELSFAEFGEGSELEKKAEGKIEWMEDTLFGILMHF